MPPHPELTFSDARADASCLRPCRTRSRSASTRCHGVLGETASLTIIDLVRSLLHRRLVAYPQSTPSARPSPAAQARTYSGIAVLNLDRKCLATRFSSPLSPPKRPSFLVFNRRRAIIRNLSKTCPVGNDYDALLARDVHTYELLRRHGSVSASMDQDDSRISGCSSALRGDAGIERRRARRTPA